MKHILLLIPRLMQTVACMAIILIAEPLLILLNDNEEDKP